MNTKPVTRRLLPRFLRSAKGNISIIAAMAFIPFAMLTSAAVDMSNAIRMKAELQGAVDAGALAAATAMASGQSNTSKTKLAKSAFYSNLSQKLLNSLTVTPEIHIDFEHKTVNMSANVTTNQVLTHFMVDSLNLGVKAKAVIDKGTPICMMSFNKTDDKAMYFQGTADIVASGCAVQVNSASNIGLDQDGTGTATADTFCVYGDYSGTNYTPSPDNQCRQQEDPLATYFNNAISGMDLTTCTVSTQTVIKNDSELSPGTYCNGITVQSGTLTLKPGTYVVRDGAFKVSAGATVKGDGVTIILTGDPSTYFINQGGSNLILSAPSTGPLAGIVLAQTPDSIPSPQDNTITGGGTLEISGIVYYPTQPLEITGNGQIGDTTSQFAIMADTIHVWGTGQLTIHISGDYQAAGLPELPYTLQRVRLAS